MKKIKDEADILFCGVGGHGILTTANLIGVCALNSGFDVTISEIHGMAQRGGAVTSDVRIGKKIFSPLIPDGECDIIVSTEPIEALRNIYKSNKDTIIITDTLTVKPFTVTLGIEKYPNIKDVYKELNNYCSKLFMIDALKIANELGDKIIRNTILLGVLFGLDVLPLSKKTMIDSIKIVIQKNYVEINIAGFEKGIEICEKIKEA